MPAPDPPTPPPRARFWKQLGGMRRGARRMVRVPTTAAIGTWHGLVDRFNGFGFSENSILLGFGVAVGVGGALGVVAFYKLIDLAFAVFYRWPESRLFSRTDLLAYRPLLTGAGLFTAWLLMKRLGRGHDGMTVPDVQLAVARRNGDLPAQPALARTAASAITIGSGGSAGSEGPVAVLGAAIGSWLGRAFHFEGGRTKVLVGAGTAAGISAAFNAPLAGAFFALEEIMGNFSARAFPAVVVSSVVAAVVSRAFFGNHPAFPIPDEYGYTLVREVAVFYPLLGVVAGVVSALFVRVYFRSGEWIERLRLPPALVPWLGGILVGVLVYVSGGILVGYGHLAVHLEVFGRMAWWALGLLALGKIAATALTLNSGGSGGVFTPSMYIGAATGGAFGVALTQLFPSLNLRPEAYALVGMGALIAGATNAPITGILIVFEMTNDYAIVLPLMLTTVIAHFVARRLEPDSLYSGWLRRRGEHLQHGTDQDVLRALRVKDAFQRDPVVFRAGDTVATMLGQLGSADQATFPVVDAEGTLLGMVTTPDLGRIARDQHELTGVLLAVDVATPTETVTPEDDLLETIRRLGVRGATALPVVDAGTGRFVGVVTRSHILRIYERALTGASAIR